jgi:hypothetical protein
MREGNRRDTNLMADEDSVLTDPGTASLLHFYQDKFLSFYTFLKIIFNYKYIFTKINFVRN